MHRPTALAQAAMLAMLAVSGFHADAQVTGTNGANGTNFVNCIGGSPCGNGYGVVPSGSAAGNGGAALTASGTQTNSTTATGGIGGNGGNNTTGGGVFGIGPRGGPGGVGGAGATGATFTLTNSGSGSLVGGLGGTGGVGAGGASSGGVGGTGGTGGAGLDGTGFTLTNDGAITGGGGGTGGVGGTNHGAGGTGGTGGSGITGSGYTLTNTGTISGGSGGAAGAPNTTGNAGTAGADGAGVTSTGGATITSSGTISGGSSGNALSLSGGGNTLTLQATSITNGSIVSTSGSTNGGDTITLTDSAQINGGISLLAGSTLNAATVTAAGNLANGGTLAIGAGKNLTVASFTNTGTFTTTVASMSSFGRLTVTGTATLGGTLHVSAASASGLVSGSLGSVISAGSISGTFASTDTDSLLFTFAPVYTSTDVSITVASVLPLIHQTTTEQGNSPASEASQVLDQILAASSTGEIAQHFMTFSTGQEQALSNAVSQTLPSLIGGSIQATQATLTNINKVVLGRLDGLRGMPSGDASQDRHVWVKPFGSWVKQGDQGAVTGYEADTYGLVAGVDANVSSTTRLGGGVAYATSKLESASSVLDHKTDVTLWQLIGYGTHTIDDRTDLNFQFDLGRNTNSSSRSITFASSVASADYDSTSAHAGMGLTRSYPLSAEITVFPTVRADYTWIRDSGYTETGAGALNLIVGSRNAQALVVSTGAKLAYKLNSAVTLSASGALAYDVNHDQAVINAAYSGASSASFTTSGIAPKPLTVHAGVGAEYKTSTGTNILFAYDAEHRSGFDNQSASVKVRWAF
ncbi:MAG: autotransporter domain-containing protein [Aquabacterium sp.]|nr:autotransporter domain-containing protein [Aquabacterium sp.]